MSLEVFLWVAAALLIPGAAWAFAVLSTVRDTKRTSDLTHVEVTKLVEMHNNPDKYGFGVNAFDAKLAGIHAALKTLIHYVKWQAQQASGREPPPPPPEL